METRHDDSRGHSALKTKKTKKVTYITTPAWLEAVRVVGLALERFLAFQRAHHAAMQKAPVCWETTKSHKNYETVDQAADHAFARFFASWKAWNRRAKWATEARLTADAAAVAAFVDRECHVLAEVIPIGRIKRDAP